MRGVGIASAGPIDLPSGTVSPINITAWQRFPIVDRVAALAGVPVRLGGDGLCMALGEHWRGAGRGAQFMLGMVVSTGVGGDWCSTGRRMTAEPAMPDTSATSSSTPTAATVHVRRPRLRRGHRVRSAAGAVGSRARLGAPRGRRQGAGRRRHAGDAVALRAFRRGARRWPR